MQAIFEHGVRVRVARPIGDLEVDFLDEEFVVVEGRTRTHGYAKCTTPEHYARDLPVEGLDSYMFHPEALEVVSTRGNEPHNAHGCHDGTVGHGGSDGDL
jgi:hypothetical protein